MRKKKMKNLIMGLGVIMVVSISCLSGCLDEKTSSLEPGKRRMAAP